MSRYRAFAACITLLLAACGTTVNPLPGIPTPAGPSPTPVILSPTPLFLPSSTYTPEISPTGTATEIPPTPTPTSTRAPAIALEIVGCNTSLDVSHGMGEVTNAHALLRNTGGLDLTNVCATLSASDEDREHPDKQVCIASLPAGFQVIVKLTVDTGYRQDTSIRVDAISNEGISALIEHLSCQQIGLFTSLPAAVGVVVPIP